MASKTQHTEDVHLIAVMGAIGVGKTTFVNLASGSNLQVGHGVRSCTPQVQQSREFILDGKPVVLFDTPGFDDSSKTESEVLQLLADFMTSLHLGGKKLSGIIFLHRISDNHTDGIAARNFRLFRRLCGEDALRNVVIATNRWSGVDERVCRRHEEELKTDEGYFKLALDSGAKLVRHIDTPESAHAIIRQILHLPPVVFRVQEGGNDLLQKEGGYKVARLDAQEGCLRQQTEPRSLIARFPYHSDVHTPETAHAEEIDVLGREHVEALGFGAQQQEAPQDLQTFLCEAFIGALTVMTGVGVTLALTQSLALST